MTDTPERLTDEPRWADHRAFLHEGYRQGAISNRVYEESIAVLDAIVAERTKSRELEAELAQVKEERDILWERKSDEKAATRRFMETRARAVKAETELAEVQASAAAMREALEELDRRYELGRTASGHPRARSPMQQFVQETLAASSEGQSLLDELQAARKVVGAVKNDVMWEDSRRQGNPRIGISIGLTTRDALARYEKVVKR